MINCHLIAMIRTSRKIVTSIGTDYQPTEPNYLVTHMLSLRCMSRRRNCRLLWFDTRSYMLSINECDRSDTQRLCQHCPSDRCTRTNYSLEAKSALKRCCSIIVSD